MGGTPSGPLKRAPTPRSGAAMSPLSRKTPTPHRHADLRMQVALAPKHFAAILVMPPPPAFRRVAIKANCVMPTSSGDHCTLGARRVAHGDICKMSMILTNRQLARKWMLKSRSWAICQSSGAAKSMFEVPTRSAGSGQYLEHRLRDQKRSIVHIRDLSVHVRANCRLTKLSAGHGRSPYSTSYRELRPRPRLHGHPTRQHRNASLPR